MPILAIAILAVGCQTETPNAEPSKTVQTDVEIKLGVAKKAEKKKDRALEGTVETRIGRLDFINGYPSNETIEKLYNELDFQRAVQAYLWGLPMVEMAEWQKAQKDVF